MPWIMVLIAALGAAGILGLTGRAHGGTGHGVRSVSTGDVKGMSEKTVDWLLARLRAVEPPEPVLGAMCYDMAMPILVEIYVCGVCGEKTVYAEGSLLLTELPECRSIVESINGAVDFDVELVDTTLCSHCEPETVTPAMFLRVTRGDGQIAFFDAVSRFDLMLLTYFLDGSLTYTGEYGDEQPLLPHASRIAELLGTEEVSE